jgi:hypothetical protein
MSTMAAIQLRLLLPNQQVGLLVCDQAPLNLTTVADLRAPSLDRESFVRDTRDFD